ncbi:hypothetical protein ACHAXR_012377, partial [Thalassiosira sp. AJA248-18]
KYYCNLLHTQKITRTSFYALNGKETNYEKPKGPKKSGKEKGIILPKAKTTTPKKNGGVQAKSGSQSNKGKDVIKNAKKAATKKRKQSRTVSKKSKPAIIPSSKKGDTKASTTTQAALSDDDNNMFIRFSRVFQRHVVYKKRSNNTDGNTNTNEEKVMDEVVQSFEFLDEAVKSFPNARVLAPTDLPFPPPSCAVVYEDDDDYDGRGSSSNQLAVSRGRPINTDIENEESETTIAGMGLWTLCELEYDGTTTSAAAFGPSIANTNTNEYKYEQANDALRTLLQLVSSESSFVVPRHFFRLDQRRIAMRGHTPESITMNHFRLVNMLNCGISSSGGKHTVTAGLAMNPSDLAFVMQNFPQLCLYDCGELESLIRFLLQPLPPLDSIPSVALVADRGVGGANVDWPSLSGKGYGAGLSVDEATSAIRMMPELLALYYEDSRKPSMVYMYNQMQSSIPPKLINEANIQLNLEGTDPSDAYTFAYLHSLGISWSQLRILMASLPLWTTCNLGLSTYDAGKKMLPILDTLQSKLELSSAELRKLMIRMPSLMGMGMSAFDDRLDFFINEADMSIKELKEAVKRQPSLVQYGVASTLRPKLRFFIEELGIPQSSISRVIKLAPATMGLSLTDNLRPKVACIMKMCALHVHEVGNIVSTSPQILLLSQKSKIEPTLKFLAATLLLSEPRELGELIMSVPRVFHSGLDTSLAKKFEILNKLNSKEEVITIIRNNPSLLVSSTAVFEDRIERCPSQEDLATWLSPSNKGRRKNKKQSASNPRGEPILVSPSPDAAFNSMTKIYPSIQEAAQDLGMDESLISKACKDGISDDGSYLYSITDSPSILPPEQAQANSPSHVRTIPISIFCSGGIYPSDSVEVARGQSRTGGLAIQVFTDGSIHDQSQFLREFSAAAKSCFGIRVPTGTDQDRSKLMAVFPLVNPSRNRCGLFACSGALKILEEFLNSKRNEGGTLYDIKVYTESNYAWKLVKSKDRLIELGSYFTSLEMLAHLDMASYSANIDILNPLARSFRRLNGHIEPLQSPHRTFDNAKVEFIHSMDGIAPNNGGLRYVKSLNRQARSAAKWQFKRERNLV